LASASVIYMQLCAYQRHVRQAFHMRQHHISREPVVPLGVITIDDLLGELLACAIELPSLWPLCDAVVASSLHFSCIRMRNAAARDNSEV
jgi:hypothetical protein